MSHLQQKPPGNTLHRELYSPISGSVSQTVSHLIMCWILFSEHNMASMDVAYVLLCPASSSGMLTIAVAG